MFTPMTLLRVNPHQIAVDAADFDGTNDHMTRGADLTGNADSKTGIFSCWARLDGNDGVTRQIIASATSVGGATLRWRCNFLIGTNLLYVRGYNAASVEILTLESSAAYTASATWRHVLASWDLANAKGFLYVNDVADLNSSLLTDDTIDYTRADWAIGAHPGGTNDFNGPLAELYFAPGQYLDFSVVGNRRRFISATGKPVWLGANGSRPTGVAPIVYQRVADGAAVATFATNLGTGGNFSITGTLETASSSPSD